MKFKGINFRRAPNVVTLPDGAGDPSIPSNYQQFGRVCKPDAQGAIRSNWSRGGEPLYVKPIPLSGHSRTNMAYGLDGRVYLIHDGRCYTAPPKRQRSGEPAATAPEPADSPFGPPPRRDRPSSLAERLCEPQAALIST